MSLKRKYNFLESFVIKINLKNDLYYCTGHNSTNQPKNFNQHLMFSMRSYPYLRLKAYEKYMKSEKIKDTDISTINVKPASKNEKKTVIPKLD